MSDVLTPYSLAYAVTCLATYLVAAIPSGYLLVKVRTGQDVRTMGSGNIGATNVARNLGTAWFIPVFIFDFLKGFAPVFWLAPWVAATWKCPTCPRPEVTLMVFCGLFAVLGHMFPVYIRFKGGKAVATVGGVLFALSWQAALVGIVVFVLVFLLTRYVSVGSIVAAVAMPVASHFTVANRSIDSVERWLITIFLGVAAVLVIWRHRTNIRRLLDGTEHRVWTKA